MLIFVTQSSMLIIINLVVAVNSYCNSVLRLLLLVLFGWYIPLLPAGILFLLLYINIIVISLMPLLIVRVFIIAAVQMAFGGEIEELPSNVCGVIENVEAGENSKTYVICGLEPEEAKRAFTLLQLFNTDSAADVSLST
ncbi:hypothetical protein AB6A40_011068 [Gnathostoma spinigerum]|uniref:Uncharacterized protein n=1 Tax=Gnathostoma spinigerum TaxID=75299 RepID=A0ABD6EWL9_9BILA